MCFGGAHRNTYTEHLPALDLAFQKYCRMIVGPPPNTNYSEDWNRKPPNWGRLAITWCVMVPHHSVTKAETSWMTTVTSGQMRSDACPVPLCTQCLPARFVDTLNLMAYKHLNLRYLQFFRLGKGNNPLPHLHVLSYLQYFTLVKIVVFFSIWYVLLIRMYFWSFILYF